MLVKRWLAPLALLVIASLALAACGSSSDEVTGSTGENEAKVEDAIKRAFTSRNPADCTTVQTQAFLDHTNFTSGEDAIENCENAAKDPEDGPGSVRVSDVTFDGGSAKADVAITGNAFDGSTLRLGLVYDDGQWKVNEISGIPELDLARFRTVYLARLAVDTDVDPQIASCMRDVIGEATEDQVKAAILGGTEEYLAALVVDCLPITTG